MRFFVETETYHCVTGSDVVRTRFADNCLCDTGIVANTTGTGNWSTAVSKAKVLVNNMTLEEKVSTRLPA
jgi:hypothetical protein